jgi:hypothetical protein
MSKLNPQNATAYVGPGVLRKGGKITPVPNGPLIKKKGPYAGSTLKAGGKTIKKAMLGSSMFKDNPIYKKTTALRGKLGSAALGIPGVKPIVKNGGMLKRADGSTSKRGLWDNIRANKGSGKKPTAEMLKQERKIKAKK